MLASVAPDDDYSRDAILLARLRTFDVRALELRTETNGLDRLKLVAIWCAVDLAALGYGETVCIPTCAIPVERVAVLLAECPEQRFWVLEGRCLDA